MSPGNLPKKRSGARAGLTREESRELTRSRLLAAAEVEFAAHGFEGANLRDILKRANVSAGAFYHNFEDKADLFLALVDGAAAELHDVLHEARVVGVDLPPVEWVERMFERLLAFGKERRSIIFVFFREAFSSNAKIAGFFDMDQAAYIAEAEADLRLLHGRGMVPPVDFTWASYAIVMLCYSALAQQLRNPVDDRFWCRTMARFVIGGLPAIQRIEPSGPA